MTLFAHTLPYSQVVLLWTDLFSEKVEFLFILATAILVELKEKLMLLDLNTLLQTINNIQGLSNIHNVLEIARKIAQKTPASFIAQDFVYKKRDGQEYVRTFFYILGTFEE